MFFTSKLGASTFLFPALLAAVAVAACTVGTTGGDPVGEAEQAAGSCAITPIPAQSLFVTDATALANFSLHAVMSQIVATGSTTGQTPLGVYQQMLDTLNDAAHGVTGGPHCTGTLNGFPNECPRQEGALASTNPFQNVGTNPDSYVPLALVNRFDLAPHGGANCGEYRVVYGKVSGKTNFADRMLLIFEATLPNPDPAGGLAACLPVAQFWDNLSASTTTAATRAAALKSFYFTGLPGFAPVIQASNYGFGNGPNTGQIRANMFMNSTGGQGWQLREFRLSQTCSGTACTLTAKNLLVQNNPDITLFNGTASGASTFQNEFLTQVKTLARGTVPAIAMATPKVDDAAASTSLSFPGDPALTDYSTQVDSAFLGLIQGELTTLGITTLTPANIVARAETQSCAGCHEVSNGASLGGGLTWPASNGFTQVDENKTLSPALQNAFLPARATTLVSFINQHCGDAGAAPLDQPDGLTVGGSVVGAAN